MSAGKWDDLTVRLGVGVALAVVGLGAVWIGWPVFHLLLVIAAGLMVWELARMVSPDQADFARIAGLLAGLGLGFAFLMPLGLALPLLLAPPLVAMGKLARGKAVFVGYSAVILLAAFCLGSLRVHFGLTWILWLLLVVIATDIFGYFAGRFLGGPKFWPAISPKKTWSGTAAGWGAAAIVGALFAAPTGAGSLLIALSVLLSLASQLGDIAESALKRRAGLKDSSALLPGHGGLLDRFDGLLGAALVLLLIKLFTGFPAGSL